MKKIIEYNEHIVKDIFKAKEEFHKNQAKLPIEEKIRIMVELQKIAIGANPKIKEKKRVWQLS